MARFLLAVPLVMLAAAAPAQRRGVHPAMGSDPAADCASCHAQRTPAVVKDWEAGAHGLNLVKCFVCHGSTGKDFARRPAAARCEGCHAEKLPAVAAAAKGRPATCFDCHAPHALKVLAARPNPHAQR